MRTAIFVLAALALSGQPTEAACSLARLIRSIDLTGVSYIYTPGIDPETSANALSITDDFDADFWALGTGNPEFLAGNDSGDFGPIDDWILTYPGYPPYILGTWAQSPAIDGCVTAGDEPFCTVVLLQDRAEGVGYYALLSSLADVNINFSYRQPGDAPIILTEIPQAPLLDQEQIDATRVQVRLGAPDVGGGNYLACGNEQAGHRIFQQVAARGATMPSDPSIEGGGWIAASDDLAPGEIAELEFDCASGNDIFLATQLLFDSGYRTENLSAPIRVSCSGCVGIDEDGDGFCLDDELLPDCDDTDPTVFPDAPQLCDGINNDCRDSIWPTTPASEIDQDGDFLSECQGDCDETDPEVSAAADERCNGVDDNCNNLVDDVNGFRDLDGDGVDGACDLCPFDFNPDQEDLCDASIGIDSDGDGESDATDACPETPEDAAVDSAGCSIEQFCGAVTIDSFFDQLTCAFSDWRNDEPLEIVVDRDCRLGFAATGGAQGRRGFGLLGDLTAGGPSWSCVPR